MSSNQRQIIEQAFPHYEKLLKNKQKRLKSKEKWIDAIVNQNEMLATLTIKDNHKDNFEEIFGKLVKKYLVK